jgi:DNA invertase Pin-like site-specific DNA recombinase
MQHNPENRVPDQPVIAYSYIRFSHPNQAEGDSLRRQTRAAQDWSDRNVVRLDTTTTLHDLGKSAFKKHRSRGEDDPMAAFINPEDLINPDRRALAGFHALIKQRKVPRGAYLIIENLDRLSRDDVVPATHLLTGILLAGVRIVQLKPVEQVLTAKSEGFAIMMAVMELSRGHGESVMKSERSGGAWAQKKKDARDRGELLTHRLPAWIEERGGKLLLIPERAATVKRIFALAAGGYGHASIVKCLTEEGVPAFGQSGRWTRPYIAKILTGRVALGECQPCGRGRRPDGPPIPDYFPAAVSEPEWLAARAGAAERRQKRGRIGHYINVFAGLLKNALEGDSYFVSNKGAGPVLVNTRSLDGLARCLSFPFPTFERAILSLLREIDAKDILEHDDGPDERLTLAAQLDRLKASITAITADMDLHGESPALFRRLREKEDEQRRLAARLDEARQKAVRPLARVWDQAHSLLNVLDNATDSDDARMRLRTALRQIVSGMWLLVVPRGRDRLCAVQVQFNGGGGRRDYLILHRSPLSNGIMRREGGWWAKSLADAADLGPLDLCDQAATARLESALSEMPLDSLMALLTAE